MERGVGSFAGVVLSGGTTGQSIGGTVSGLPEDAVGLRVELIATSQQNGSGLETAFRVHLAELVNDSRFESSYGEARSTRATSTPPCWVGQHVLTFYSGVAPDTAGLVATVDAPTSD